MMLRTILVGALIAGTITGVLLTAIQQFQVTPLILEAELYESPNADHVQSHDQAIQSLATDSSIPDEDNQRLLFSLLSNIFAGIGFAMIIASAITFSGQMGWRKGLLWGVAGFNCVFLLPRPLGLHPELPGTEAAPLLHRQLWWVATAAVTAAGIAMLVFSRRITFKGIGILLLFIPHIVGAPLPEQAYTSAPELLVEKFAIASTITNAIFWLILGTLSGYFLRKLDDTFLE